MVCRQTVRLPSGEPTCKAEDARGRKPAPIFDSALQQLSEVGAAAAVADSDAPEVVADDTGV